MYCRQKEIINCMGTPIRSLLLNGCIYYIERRLLIDINIKKKLFVKNKIKKILYLSCLFINYKK